MLLSRRVASWTSRNKRDPLVQAKAASGWRMSQIASKARRLGRIFGEDGHRFPHIEPHFVLMSPKHSSSLDEKLTLHPEVPSWMRRQGKVAWAQLDMPTDRLLITRCDASGSPSKTGDQWRLVEPCTAITWGSEGTGTMLRTSEEFAHWKSHGQHAAPWDFWLF